MTPKSENELAEAIKDAAGPLRITGGGTRDIGGPVTGQALSTAGLAGIQLYEPGALTIVAQAGTPVAQIEAALAKENQRMAFEPIDHRTLLGTKGTPTIGGVVSGNASGSRRIAVGACRDHMLGLRFVDGAGTITKNGGRVMKNVTGYDLVKLLTGSYGTLGVLSEVSMKVLPKPETSATLRFHGLDPTASVAVMSKALGSPFEVTGAARLEDTFLRIEGFEASIAYRVGELKSLLGGQFDVSVLEKDASEALWVDITNVKALANLAAVWSVSIKPSDAPDLIEDISKTLDFHMTMDWGGGRLWFGLDDAQAQAADPSGDAGAGMALSHRVLQEYVGHCGGHATLVKAPAELRAAVSVFQPENQTLTALSAGIRARFDPRGILNPGLMA